MRWLDRAYNRTPRSITFLVIVLSPLAAFFFFSAAGLHAQAVGSGGAPGSGSGGGAVSSVFGRTGAVVAATGDYTAAEVTNAAATNTANTFVNAQTYNAGTLYGYGQGSEYQGASGYYWTVYATASASPVLTFSSSGYSNLGWIRGNSYNYYGFGLLSSSSAGYLWASSNTSNSYVTGLFNVASGVVGIGNGTSTTAGTLESSAILPGVLYSAAGTVLPACSSSIQGERAVVKDATSPTYMGAYTSGGGITAQVICSYNGTTYSWLTN